MPNQYSLATKKPSHITQFKQRVHIQARGKPVEWLCEVLATGQTPSGEPVDVTKRIDIAMFLASKLVAAPKPVLASAQDAGMEAAGELAKHSAAAWVRELEASKGHQGVIDVQVDTDSLDEGDDS